jgi:putative phosphoesterase
MVRVAILADTHGHLDPRVEELVADCDLAVHGGDIGNAAVLARLQPRQARIIAVVGNNDLPRKWPEEDGHLLELLPEQVELSLPGGCLTAIHGHQFAARNRHHRLVADRESEPWVLNPGAAGRARTYGGPSCMILLASERRWDLRIERFEPFQPRRP